ncbi:ankyrin [Aspergillus brunneoviolaceus CBS 621.78]|uniref:Ankyrin n=1 Tax=Aspergillus brunneoviolaceus CBS 621.78 TaxID=1450534 RepID=A0ACD1GE96_9EURO|nr:ankyrin [Aspergillus brunneoviolaceus CBS 621.78]RAH47434.1 ankyrin [Aspergillus brunneoviolaceus CBS 621.78]
MTYKTFDEDNSSEEPNSAIILDISEGRPNEVGVEDPLDEIIQRNDVLGLLRYNEEAKDRGEDIFSRVRVSSFGYDPWPPFYSAAYHGSLEALRALIDIYRSDPAHRQPLEEYLQGLDFRLLNLACGNADRKMTRFLLDHQPPLGAWRDRDTNGATPLVCAAQAFVGNVEALERKMKDTSFIVIREKLREHQVRYGEFIEFCLASGASVREADQYVPSYALGRQAQPGDPQEILGDTVLGSVVPRASYAMVSRLIAAGADAHVVQTWYDPCAFGSALRCSGVTPLHIASKYWNLDAMQALLDHRGRIELAEMVSRMDGNGRPPLYWALMGDEDEIATLTPSEVTSRMLRTVKLILDIGPAMVNVKDHDNKTVLHYAVDSHVGDADCLAAVKLLLEYRPDRDILNAQGADLDDPGSTVLHYAVSRRADDGVKSEIFFQLLDILVIHGADPTMCDEAGRTMLYPLAIMGTDIRPIDDETLEKVLTLVDINHADVNGDTSLHHFVRRLRQIREVDKLLNRGADVNAVNKKGNTPLHVAVGASTFPSVRRMDDGGYVEIPLEDRLEALEKMIEILQDAGASMDQANLAGETPREILKETRERWALKDFSPRWR